MPKNPDGRRSADALGTESLHETRRVPAAERVLDHILGEMDAGRLRPGARVNAARIAATLRLSAAPVREALSVLAGRGVLDLLPDRGALIRPISAHEAIKLWQVLTPIVAVGLRLGAARVAAGADTNEIANAYRAIHEDPLGDGPVAFLLRLNEYHFAVNRLGGNEFVTIALDRLGVSYWDRYLGTFIDIVANLDGYLRNYRRMHEAVMDGDGPAAAAVLHYHADWSIALIGAAAAANERPGRRRKPTVAS